MESQNKQILAHLKKGNAITALGAVKKFNCLRLSARIDNLKNKGHDIYTKIVHDPQDRRRHWAVYFMENSIWYKQMKK